MTGVDKKDDEDVGNIFKNLLKSIEVGDDCVEKLTECKRLPSKNVDVEPAILLSFSELSAAEKVVKAAKAKKLKSDTLGFQPSRPVYVNERLAPDCYKLLKEAKVLRKHGYEFVWSRYGKVFVRKEAGSAVKLVKSVDEIMALK